jgi:putative flippase GtrA
MSPAMADAPRPAGADPGHRARIAEVVRFGVAGAVNTAFGFGVYSGLVLLGLPAFLSLLIATIAGVFFNFLTFGAFAFRQFDARRLPRFLGAYGLIYLFNLALLEGLRAATGLGPIYAQFACLAVVAPTAYLVLKAKVFRESLDE